MKGGGPEKDLQEGMVTFLGRLAIRGSLCLLLCQMRGCRKGCTPCPPSEKYFWRRPDFRGRSRNAAKAWQNAGRSRSSASEKTAWTLRCQNPASGRSHVFHNPHLLCGSLGLITGPSPGNGQFLSSSSSFSRWAGGTLLIFRFSKK